MAYFLSEDNAYKLWQMLPNRSWESLYNLLYNDYYEGHKIGWDENLIYQLMQMAQTFQSNEAQFPQTEQQFYETISQRLGSA